jgi:hypothetical protein
MNHMHAGEWERAPGRIPRTSHFSLGDALGRSPAEAPRAASLATLTEGATTGGTAETAAAAVPAEEASPEGDPGHGGKHHPFRLRIQLQVYGLTNLFSY